MNHLSKEWENHCANVAAVEKARLYSERLAKVTIGKNYVPPPFPIQGCVELPTEPEPGIAWQVIVGILIAGTFMATAYLL